MSFMGMGHKGGGGGHQMRSAAAYRMKRGAAQKQGPGAGGDTMNLPPAVQAQKMGGNLMKPKMTQDTSNPMLGGGY